MTSETHRGFSALIYKSSECLHERTRSEFLGWERVPEFWDFLVMFSTLVFSCRWVWIWNPAVTQTSAVDSKAPNLSASRFSRARTRLWTDRRQVFEACRFRPVRTSLCSRSGLWPSSNPAETTDKVFYSGTAELETADDLWHGRDRDSEDDRNVQTCRSHLWLAL